MKTFSFFFLLLMALQVTAQKNKKLPPTDRQVWIAYLDKIARPVIYNLAQDSLKQKMPLELSKTVDNKAARTKASYLEAFGRTLSGIGPWLQGEGGDDAEKKLRQQYRAWCLSAVKNAVNPGAKDYLEWTGGQPLVDASFFAFGLVRCPWLWESLDSTVKGQVVTALQKSRSTVPGYSNWILFSGMIEAFFCKYGYDYDALRIEYGLREFAHHWYAGDGMFSDGMQFHNDYYNSYVIQPYLVSILSIINKKGARFGFFSERMDKISRRYAEIQERMINSDGSFPVTGRSITYRAGAFHHLADVALRKQLPSSLKPAQVRSALTSVLKKTLDHPATFRDGWLTIGLHGYQPDLAEAYINTGSIYLCTAVFLPLGLSPEDEFWAAPSMPWTSVKVWSGENSTKADHALDL
jgi:hypothetical protein